MRTTVPVIPVRAWHSFDIPMYVAATVTLLPISNIMNRA